MLLQRINLYFGLLLFIVFLLTGYYMEHYFKTEHIEHVVMRMQIRANHIYVLFVALLNIMASKCKITLHYSISIYLDVVFRALLIFSGALTIIAFANENTGDLNDRNITLYSIILSVAGVGFMLVNQLINLNITTYNKSNN